VTGRFLRGSIDEKARRLSCRLLPFDEHERFVHLTDRANPMVFDKRSSQPAPLLEVLMDGTSVAMRSRVDCLPLFRHVFGRQHVDWRETFGNGARGLTCACDDDLREWRYAGISRGRNCQDLPLPPKSRQAAAAKIATAAQQVASFLFVIKRDLPRNNTTTAIQPAVQGLGYFFGVVFVRCKQHALPNSDFGVFSAELSCL